MDVAVGPGGEIYVADIEAAALLRWSGNEFEVVAKGRGLPKTPLFGIRHIVPRGGTVLASDPPGNCAASADTGSRLIQVPTTASS